MMMDRIENLLKELTEALGTSGFEGEVFDIMKGRLAKVAKIEKDRLGSLIARLETGKDSPRVMLTAHMD